MSEFDDLMRQKAVALKYNPDKNGAPVIVASGMGYLAERIQTDVSDILKKNGIRLGQFSVYGRVRDRKVTEVFPEIREKETTINVRI